MSGEEAVSVGGDQVGGDGTVEREAADGDFQAFGDFLFLFGSSGPVGGEPSGIFLGPVGFEGSGVGAGGDVGVAEGAGFFEEAVVDFVEDFAGAAEEVLLVGEFLGGGGLVAALDAEFAGFDVAGSDFDADGDAFFDPLPFFHAAAEVAGVDVDADGFAVIGLVAEGIREGFAGGEDGFAGVFLGGDGEDDDVLGCDARGEHEAVVIGVCHDEGADEACGDAP